jgi:hypothetical protein
MYLEDGILSVETCQDSDEFNLISRTSLVVNCTVTVDSVMGYKVAQPNIKKFTLR